MGTVALCLINLFWGADCILHYLDVLIDNLDKANQILDLFLGSPSLVAVIPYFYFLEPQFTWFKGDAFYQHNGIPNAHGFSKIYMQEPRLQAKQLLTTSCDAKFWPFGKGWLDNDIDSEVPGAQRKCRPFCLRLQYRRLHKVPFVLSARLVQLAMCIKVFHGCYIGPIFALFRDEDGSYQQTGQCIFESFYH